MPSARKRGARSSSPRGPARTPHDTNGNTDGSADAGNPRSAEASRYEDRPRPLGVARGFSRASRTILVLAIVLAIAGAVLLMRRRAGAVDLRAVAGQNVLLITIDTLRADALGAYGGAAATPALDAL